ncbi:DUF2637 domain-containing protein [Streptomyces sp. enrichment culture]|uniref:DUF2637 domain-containing protein n=1 Tax=Streptomyces sp. enrichment culture TaxID=1795815 RepID=UPI003F55D922
MEHDTPAGYDGVPIPAQQSWEEGGPDTTPGRRGLEEELAEMLAAASPPRPTAASGSRPPSRGDRRRTRPTSPLLIAVRRINQVTVLFAVIAVCAACLLGWSITYTYGQLRTIAEFVLPSRLAQWWPLTVYGPWFVAALSILRATVQHQAAPRSWGVLLVTSAMAVALCVSHSTGSVLAYVTLGIPPITALVCFWELVGQVSSKHRGRKGAHAPRPKR